MTEWNSKIPEGNGAVYNLPRSQSWYGACRVWDLHHRQVVTQVRGIRHSDKSKLTVSLIMESGCFLGFSDGVTTEAWVFSSAVTTCKSVSEVKTHCLRTSVSSLLCVTSLSLNKFFICYLSCSLLSVPLHYRAKRESYRNRARRKNLAVNNNILPKKSYPRPIRHSFVLGPKVND